MSTWGFPLLKMASSAHVYSLVFFAVACFLVLQTAAEDSRRAGRKHVDIYKSLFDIKRREQIETTERVWNIDDYAKQYKSVTFVVNTLFPVLEEALNTIREIKFEPGVSPFPEEEAVQEVLGKVYENVIFLGDFVLRMPEITKKVLKMRKEWLSILKEAVMFCNQSSEIYTGPHARQLHLMSQELELVPMDEDYINPFKKEFKAKTRRSESSEKLKKEAKKKGPRLRSLKNEL